VLQLGVGLSLQLVATLVSWIIDSNPFFFKFVRSPTTCDYVDFQNRVDSELRYSSTTMTGMTSDNDDSRTVRYVFFISLLFLY
jgi:hypothetical protein